MELPSALRPGAISSWKRTITEDDVARFAELSGDRGRHHLERDEKGRLMAHGLLTATLPTKLGGDMNYIARTMAFDFLKPVFAGDVLTCDGKVISAAVQSARYKVRFFFEVRNQDGEVVLTGTTSGQIKR
ncbi:MAG TPA: hotdog domain-containing protein [Elusimicrobiota bacterium]|jgi:acyl dehydratase|nr:hotdog domain-containing protein [Elusimicrobiota bacterium]